MRRSLFCLLACSLLFSCSAGEGPHVPEGCNPLFDDPDRCLLPFPSSWFLAEGQDTATGLRVQFPRESMPLNYDEHRLDPRRLEMFDGFSPLTPILVAFPEGIDPTGIPGVRQNGKLPGEDFSASTAADSTVQVIDLESGQRVPHFAELDANTSDPARRTLIIRPQVRLAAATRHAVVLRGLRDAEGAPLAPPEPFRLLREGKESKDSPLRRLRPKYDVLFRELEAMGLPRGELTLAWEFTTASDATIREPMLAMRAHALEEIDAGRLSYEIEKVEDDEGAHLLRRIHGRLEVPAFLDSEKADSRLDVDAGGFARSRGKMSFPFVLHVPTCAETATEPLPVMMFGHGIFGQAASEMGSSYQKELTNELCMVQAGMDWIGLTPEDRGYVVTEVLLDFTNFDAVSDRLRQAHVNQIVFARQLLRTIKDHPSLKIGGRALLDGSTVYYYGLSNGAIQGTTFMALSPDVERGVLGVGGGPWTLMMSRSSNFGPITLVLNQTYPDPVVQQLLIALTQPLWDYTDPATWAGRVVRDPLPGNPAKKLLVHESLADTAVPNLATRFNVRELGVPGVAPLLERVFEVEEKEGALESGYVQWETNPAVRDREDNRAPDTNPAHDTARRYVEVVEQMRGFLQPAGQVVNTCPDGICDCIGRPVERSAMLRCQ